MSTAWILVAAVGAATVALKAAGPVLLGARPLPGRAAAVVGLLAPALLAALVAVQTLADGAALRVDARVAGVAAAALALAPVVLGGDSLTTMYDRTLGFQAGRDSPFSPWGQYGWAAGQAAWQVVAVVGAVALALVARRRDTVGLAAVAAAVLIAFQLGATHWFYLYVVWFFPLVMVALLGRYAEPGAPAEAPSHGTSSGEIDEARSGLESSPTRTPISHGSSSAVS